MLERRLSLSQLFFKLTAHSLWLIATPMEDNTTLHINEVEGLRFAHIHLNNVRSELALAIKYLTSSTHDHNWERLSSLSDIGGIISDMMADIREEVMVEICPCEDCVSLRSTRREAEASE